MNAMVGPTDQVDGGDIATDVQWVRWSEEMLDGQIVYVFGGFYNFGGRQQPGFLCI